MTDADARIARLEDLVERRLAAFSVTSGDWTAPQIKEFVESLLVEKDRALKNQILQIREALTSADKLEVARVDAVMTQMVSLHASSEQHVDQLRRERELVTNGQQLAIQKAELATEKRFASVNEFREQLAHQAATFVPREVFDAQTRRLATVEGFQARILGALAVVGVLVPLLTALAVYLLTRHGIPVSPTPAAP